MPHVADCHLGAEVGAMVGVLGVLNELSREPPVHEGRLVGECAPSGDGARELGAEQCCLEAAQGPADFSEAGFGSAWYVGAVIRQTEHKR